MHAVMATVFVACLAAAVQAQAAEAADGPPPGWVGPPPGWSAGVLAGGARMPRYEGSRQSRMQPVLGVQVSYRSMRWGTLEMGSRGLGWTAVQQPALSLGAALQWDPGRVDHGDDKLTAMGYRPGAERLRGMGEVKAAPVLSLQAAGSAAGVSASAALRRALGSHDGTQLALGLSWPVRLGPHARLKLESGATWADRRWQVAYFGVTPRQAMATRFERYQAGGGWKSAQLALQFEADFSRDWHLQATLQRRRLLNHAAESPVTEVRDSTTGMLAVLYTFQW